MPKNKSFSICYAITVCDESEELKNLLDALKSYKRGIDEILIQGDEGNVTMDVKRVLGEYEGVYDKYIEYPLQGDYSRFKNNLAKNTLCDYIFQIDADEIPSPILLQKLPLILEDNPDVELIKIPRINVMIDNDEPFILWSNAAERIQRQDVVNYPDYQGRIYRNREEIRFFKPIHERIMGMKSYAKITCKGDLFLLHCKKWEKQERRWTNTIGISLIIISHKWSESLKLCLKSVLYQNIYPNEIIVVEDETDEETCETTNQIVEAYRKKFSIPIFYIKREGKTGNTYSLLNKAVETSTLPYIIQIDGDVILEKNFIKDHEKMAEKDCFIRVKNTPLTETETKEIIKKSRVIIGFRDLGFINQLKSLRISSLSNVFATKWENPSPIKGCNMAFWKSDFEMVNGYDNDLLGYGNQGEELSWRLLNAGLTRKSVKMKCVAFHLFHKPVSKNIDSQRDIIKDVKKKKIMKTGNGFSQIK